MIKANIPQRREEVKTLIAQEVPEVELVSEKGMILEYKSENEEEAAKKIKAVIKSSDFGSSLFL